MSSRRTIFPPAAIDWLVPGSTQRVLDVGSGTGAFAQMIRDAGHRVICVDSDREKVRRIAAKMGRMQVVAQAESLPFDTCRFDVVTVQESVTRFAPGLALAEFARVLRPGGHLAVVFNTRDDSVPWVKRLTRRIQQDDPSAMRGDYGSDSIAALEESPYFHDLAHQQFRNWIPIDRDGLLEMVWRRPAVDELDPSRRDALLNDVGHIYDTSARPPEPLLLPFQASCWRAKVDHAELTMPIQDSGLQIAMKFNPAAGGR